MSDQLHLPGIDVDYLGAAPPALCPPVIKYAGGKSWLLPLLVPGLHRHLANHSGVYVEPFCGGLAMGLGVGWPRSVFSDASPDLVNLYSALALDAAQVADVQDELKLRGLNEATFYEVRREVWPSERHRFSQFEWAARVLYLNKTAFNGLWRVNRRGEFNVPHGRYERPGFTARDHLLRAGAILARSDLQCADFGKVLDEVARAVEDGVLEGRQVVMLCDPPYGASVPDSTTRGARQRAGGVFTGYSVGGFGWEDQERLGALCCRLARLGCLVVATNSWSDEVAALYPGFARFHVGVQHSVGAKADRRGKRAELLLVDEAHQGIVDMGAVRAVRA